jgi:hypothetical protein
MERSNRWSVTAVALIAVSMGIPIASHADHVRDHSRQLNNLRPRGGRGCCPLRQPAAQCKPARPSRLA